jgi:D-lactate dehydrogenase
MKRIAFFEAEPWEREIIRRELGEFDARFPEGQPSGTGDLEVLESEAISVFVGARLDQATLHRFPRLRFVSTRSTGFDHIDLAECARRGVVVSNVPAYGSRTVAEFTFALLLALSKKLDRAIWRVRSTGSFALDGLRGWDLCGKVLGVIGTGHIGKEVIRIASGFRMEVLATDLNPDLAFAQEMGFRYVELDELLASSDAITVHVPHLPLTTHLLNRENLSKVKPGAVLINTARGAVVETTALIDALHQGRLAGAALDVLEEEGAIREERELVLYGHPEQQQLRTILQNHVLMRMENVIVTPHNAFNTHEALREIVRVTIENIRGFFSGTPRNTVALSRMVNP